MDANLKPIFPLILAGEVLAVPGYCYLKFFARKESVEPRVMATTHWHCCGALDDCVTLYNPSLEKASPVTCGEIALGT